MANSIGPARVHIQGGFSPGTKVGLARRHTDFAPKRLNAEQTATVTDDSTVTFTGLPEGIRYWAFNTDDDTRRVLSATSKIPVAAKDRLSDKEIRDRLRGTAAHPVTGQSHTLTNPQTRTRTVVVSPGGLDLQGNTGQPTKAEDRELEPQPRLRQEDARKVPQRSATLTGSAHPVEAGEPQPHPAQEDFQNVPQRSATETGEATPVLAVPESQEDARKLHQRSATELGRAEPKPAGDPIHQALTRDASVVLAATDQADRPEPASKASEQGKKRPAPSKVKKADSSQSETALASKGGAEKNRAVRKQASKQSDN